jgi:hypothetical protein
MKRIGILIAMVTTMAAPGARACGACVEDKVAATYDHAVIHTAIAKRQQVVFVAVDGTVDINKIGTRIAAAAPKVRGVVASTLRTSVAPPAFSFALDAAQTPEIAMAGFRKAIADSGVRLTMVRIMRDGALIEPPSQQ